ncbi:uncharacterized protein LOC141697454 [Apium graveolens]|uniref:uncharacterized protein LOC141697454 n=1 Tax=Apium graveolens TaxID=4045 RepID=UPI003D7B69CE
MECVPQTINQAQNSDLVKDVTDEEVRDALFQMNLDKAPGHDGMTPGFFQKHWRIVGKYVITKVMANRLKLVLDSVISDTQSVFIHGRLISDNIMVSYEVMHYLKCKRVGKDGYMALKLDMSKAYDRIEWNFLKVILRRMEFSEWWVKLVLQCVSTVQYTIVHGTQDMGPILPTRGKQGWRFITNPDSLVSRLFKAKYFADGDYLNASLGHNPSFIWRSVFEEKQLLRDGVRWRVGNGEKIKVLGQPWISKGVNLFITTTSPVVNDINVASLLCADRKEWDVEVIQDAGVWNIVDNSSIWKLLWRIKAPPKSLNVVWRALSGCLPTMSQLQSKHVPVEHWWLCALLLNSPQAEGDGASSCVRPQTNSVKVSADATIFADQESVGFGLVARDSEGSH